MLSAKDRALLKAFEKGYRALEDGTLISPRGRKLSSKSKKRGYIHFSVCLREGGASRDVKVAAHRFIAFLKYGNRLFNPGLEVRHLNGNKTDNSFSNLVLGTHSQNMMDRGREERREHGKKAARFLRSLTPDQVKELRRDRDSGKSYKYLCQKYGVAKSTVSYIVNRKTYPEL